MRGWQLIRERPPGAGRLSRHAGVRFYGICTGFPARQQQPERSPLAQLAADAEGSSQPLRQIEAQCQPDAESALRVTMPRWYSVRPAFLRIACVLAARSMGSGCGVAPLIASSASRTKA